MKNKFNFREYQKIENTTIFMESLGMKGFFGKREQDCDFLNIFPEISNEINKFNYRKLIFVELSAYGVSSNPSQSPSIGGERWYISMYVVDLANKKIQFRGKMSDGGSRESQINLLLSECSKVTQE